MHSSGIILAWAGSQERVGQVKRGLAFHHTLRPCRYLQLRPVFLVRGLSPSEAAAAAAAGGAAGGQLYQATLVLPANSPLHSVEGGAMPSECL